MSLTPLQQKTCTLPELTQEPRSVQIERGRIENLEMVLDCGQPLGLELERHVNVELVIALTFAVEAER